MSAKLDILRRTCAQAHRSRLPLRALLGALLAVSMPGCARIPAEAVELSVTVGKDLTEVHRANRRLAQHYFGRMQSDIDEFVETVYRPFVIRFTMEDLDLIKEIQNAAAAPNDSLDPLDIMEVYAETVLDHIDDFRDSLMTPILLQESQALAAIDSAFERLRDANAIVTGHLASVRKVNDAQSEFLGTFGLQGLPERVAGSAAALSDTLSFLLTEARSIDERLSNAPGALAEVRARFDKLSSTISRLRNHSNDSNE